MANSEPDNIKAFNYLTLMIFDRLYNSFPERKPIDSLEFVIDTAWGEDSDSKKSKYAQLLPDTMHWLYEEGFIKWEHSTSDGKFNNVTLTLKGLTVLGYVPHSIDGPDDSKHTTIERIRSVVSRGAESAASDLVKSIIGAGFTLALSSFRE